MIDTSLGCYKDYENVMNYAGIYGLLRATRNQLGGEDGWQEYPIELRWPDACTPGSEARLAAALAVEWDRGFRSVQNESLIPM